MKKIFNRKISMPLKNPVNPFNPFVYLTESVVNLAESSIEKSKFNFYIFILILLITNSCQKKDIELKLVETACKNFKISNAVPQWISDPSCGGTSVNASFKVMFNYDGEKDCIDRIEMSPKFYRADNSEISGVAFPSRLLKDDPLVTITGSTVTFTLNFQFASASDADALNHVYMKFHTENDLESESNKLEIRINSTCFVLDPGTYGVVSTVNVNSSTVDIILYDHASEDGDIVSVYLNGVWVLENYTLTKSGESFTFIVNPGSNDLVLFAVNEGSTGPNTASISVNGGTQIEISPDLLTGEAVNIVF